MNEAIYTEQELYSKEVAAMMSQAGLIPVEEEVTFEKYMRDTSGVMF